MQRILPYRSYHTVTAALFAMLLVLHPPAASAVDEEQVLAAIEAGKASLLDRIREHAEVQFRTSKSNPAVRTLIGRVIRRNARAIVFEALDGRKRTIQRDAIVRLVEAGSFEPELTRAPFYGGHSALAAFALLAAGVDSSHPRLSALLDRMADEGGRNDVGTYVHALRATVWSAALERQVSGTNRNSYLKLLRSDISWLQQAMQPGGSFTYVREARVRGDNSNAQFAVFGLWAGAVADVEVSPRAWNAIESHWMEGQEPDGGWRYTDSSPVATPSMTVAGCNSLYVVLDRYYAQADARYVLFEGARPKPDARKAMRRIHDAIERGDQFLQLNPPNIVQARGYELLGLERLGVASGRAMIGGADWFGRYADNVARHEWGVDVVADAFALIFLVHGQAPVWIQKLEHGRVADRTKTTDGRPSASPDWNYYHRDLSALSRFMSRTFERIYRWQRLGPDPSLRDLQDAPILYISGQDTLELADAVFDRVRQYVDAGGVVFLHADRANAAFVRTATALFERMFSDRGLTFAALAEDHPLYTCYFGGPQSPWKRPVPLRAIADGPRLLVILCPVDIAGAWHQDRLADHPDLYRIMANVRTYVAPPYTELPTRLRPDPRAGPAAGNVGRIVLGRLRHAGDWDAHPGAWQRYSDVLSHRAGLSLRVREAVGSDAGELAGCDVLHLTTRDRLELPAELRSAIVDYVRSGGLLLIDAADGQPDAVAAVRPLLDAIDVGDRGVLGNDHPIVTGAFEHGRPLGSLKATAAGAGLTRASDVPPIWTRAIDGRVAVLACPFDLIAGVDGHFVWNRSGYVPDSTRRLVDNILLWRRSEMNARPAPPPSADPRPR